MTSFALGSATFFAFRVYRAVSYFIWINVPRNQIPRSELKHNEGYNIKAQPVLRVSLNL